MWKGHAARTLASRGLRGLGLGACERSDWSLAVRNRRSNARAQLNEVAWAVRELLWRISNVDWWVVTKAALVAIGIYLGVLFIALV